MRNCPKCGIELKNDDVFCSKCGIKLIDKPKALRQEIPTQQPKAFKKPKNVKILEKITIGAVISIPVIIVAVYVWAALTPYKPEEGWSMSVLQYASENVFYGYALPILIIPIVIALICIYLRAKEISKRLWSE